MNKSCKIAITWNCNLSCSYCCNDLPEVQDKFQYGTIDEILAQNYENISITGGEIGLIPDRLNKILEIFGKTSSKLWLYTNGSLLPQMLVRPERINGINISVHRNLAESLLCVNKWKKYQGRDKSPNIRLHIQDEMYFSLGPSDKDLIELFVPKQNLKIWKLNECMNNNEDWYSLY